jgi:RecJ-like exonuclease
MVRVRKDLTGKVFGKLTVLQQTDDYINKKGIHHAMWLCQCACGNTTTVLGTDLTRKDKKHIVSCGHCYSNYRLFRDYGECYMKNGIVCLFDIEDYDKIKEYHWHQNSDGYVVCNIQRDKKLVTILMHRLVMDAPDDAEVDHIHGNKLDNRKSELRIVAQSDNKKNRSMNINNTSGYKGVSWDKHKQKWVANIQCDGKPFYLGAFTSAYDAHIRYEKAAKALFGEYKRKEDYNTLTQQNDLTEEDDEI